MPGMKDKSGDAGPLSGVRVIDAATMIAGPYAATLMGDLGADVIKIEPPAGDDMRRIGRERGGETGSFLGVNGNKRGIVLDLAQEEGPNVLRRLLLAADVLITNVREPALSKLGLSYEQAFSVRHDIIWAGVSTFGPSGPYAGRPGVDALAQALCGVPTLNGGPDQPPVRLNMPIADVMTSLLVVSGVTSALYERWKSGEGRKIEVALIDALVHALCNSLGNYLLTGWVVPRTGNRSPYFAPSGIYSTADGGHVFISCPTDKFWHNLCTALAPQWREDPRFVTHERRMEHEDALDRDIAEKCRMFTRSDLIARLAASDVMASPVNSLPEVTRDPQVLHNQMLRSVHHATLGDITVTGAPIRVDGVPGDVRRAPPALGQHTDEVLAELGYTPEEARDLARLGITTPRPGGQVNGAG